MAAQAGRPGRDYESLSSQFEQKVTGAQGNDLHILKKHFLPLTSNRPFSGHKYYSAILAVITTSHVETAIEAVEAGCSLKYTEAEKAVLEAVNAAPAPWKESHSEELESKGFIRGEDFFHRVRPLHRADTVFAQLRPKIAKGHQPILMGAIDSTYKHTNKYGLRLSDTTLTAVVVQLMPDGEEKSQWMEKLSKAGGKNGLTWKSSAKAIEVITERMGIDPQTLPSIHDPLKSPQHLANKAAFAAQETEQEEAVKNDPQAELKRKLAELVLGGTIETFERDVYLYAVTPRHDGVLPSEMHVTSKFSFRKGSRGSQEQILKLDRLREIMVTVKTELANFEKQEQQYAQQITPESP